MFSRDEFIERYSQPEVVENKRALSELLAAQQLRFEAAGGKVTELPYGVKALPNEVRIPATCDTDSGYPGISWSPDREKWSVRTTNSRKHLGFAKTLCEALRIQEQHSNKQDWKES